jgi:SNF2 family DNA or RNA helicase
VYRFITKDSFEEKIDKMIKAKQELSNLSVSIGENWLGKMDREELRGIFG